MSNVKVSYSGITGIMFLVFVLSRMTPIFGQENQPPNPPVLVFPNPEAEIAVHREKFQIRAIDPNGDNLKFKIVVMQTQPPPPPPLKGRQGNVQVWVFDQTKDQAGWDKESYASGEVATFIVPENQRIPAGEYLWWALATDNDGQRWSLRSEQRKVKFVPNTAPNCPTLLFPESGVAISPTPTFKVKSDDPEEDQVKFRIEAKQGGITKVFDTPFVASGAEATYTVPSNQAFIDGQWTWKAKAIDKRGAESGWSETRSFIVRRDAPDLVPKDLWVNPTAVMPGGIVTVSVKVFNQGRVKASASKTKIQLSQRQDAPSPSDYMLVEFSTPELNPGQSLTHTQGKITIPSNIQFGNYYLWVTVDADGTANQIDRANDQIRTELRVGLKTKEWRWPVDNPTWSNDYASFNRVGNKMYHVGVDILGVRGTPVKAAASGNVVFIIGLAGPGTTSEKIVLWNHNNNTVSGELPTNRSGNNHGLGITIVIEHDLGGGKKAYSLYGHLDAVRKDIWEKYYNNGKFDGKPWVNVGDKIGLMGFSVYSQRSSSNIHVHFEVKKKGVLEAPSGDLHWGYTPDLPDGYGYIDPMVMIKPFSSESITPTPFEMTNDSILRTGPGVEYAALGWVKKGQRFVAIGKAKDDKGIVWYCIDIPNSRGKISAWIRGSDIKIVSDAKVVEVKNDSVLMRQEDPNKYKIRTWSGTQGYEGYRDVYIWKGQRFVVVKTERVNSQVWRCIDIPYLYFKDPTKANEYDKNAKGDRSNAKYYKYVGEIGKGWLSESGSRLYQSDIVFLSEGLHFISMPIHLENPEWEVILGLEPNQVKVAKWVVNKYVFYPQEPANKAQAGNGYWLKLTPGQSRKLYTLGRMVSEEQPSSIILSCGWNAIGNSFTQAIFWQLDQIQVRKGGEVKTLTQAQQAGWIEDYAWGWEQDENDPFKGKYVLVYDTSIVPEVKGQIEPWKGYWVYAHQDCELILPPPSQSNGQRARDTGRVVKGNGWMMKLVAKVGDESGEVILGVSQSSRGLAIRLPPEPPEGGSNVQIIVLNNGAPLAVDVRNGIRQRQDWDVVVKFGTRDRGQGTGTRQKEVTLTWDGIGYAPKDMSLTLVDLATGTRRYMRTQTEYRFVPNEGESERRFKVITEISNERPLRIVGLRATPMRGQTVMIEFALTKPAQAFAEVLTLTGRRISLLEVPQSDGSLCHRIIWRGFTRDGMKLPAGTYLVRLTATDEDGRQVQAVTMTQLH